MSMKLISSFFAARATQVVAVAAVCAVPLAGKAQDSKQIVGPPAPPAMVASAETTDTLAHTAGITYSSSATEPVDSLTAGTLNFGGVPASAFQPPPRRRYGRPRYNDRSHNPDGSNKFAFEGGVGFVLPVGDTKTDYKTSYGFEIGAGRNFNRNIAVMVQFDYDHLGVQDSTLRNQIAFYNSSPSCTQAQNCLGSLNGNAHVWSFSVDPTYTLYGKESIGAYVVGGVGFYHKVTNFTTPVNAIGYDYFGFPYQYTANQTIDHYTSNAPGLNGGLGFTYKFSRFANERFFAEARYVYVFNSLRPGGTFTTAGGINPPGYNGNNLFPQNSKRTSYVPVKFGIRF